MDHSIHALEEWSTNIVWAGLDLSLRLTLFLAVMFLVTKFFRTRSAATRHLVWKFAFTGFLVLPVIWLLLPRWAIFPNTLIPQRAIAEDSTVQSSFSDRTLLEEEMFESLDGEDSQRVLFDDEFAVLEGKHIRPTKSECGTDRH